MLNPKTVCISLILILILSPFTAGASTQKPFREMCSKNFCIPGIQHSFYGNLSCPEVLPNPQKHHFNLQGCRSLRFPTALVSTITAKTRDITPNTIVSDDPFCDSALRSVSLQHPIKPGFKFIPIYLQSLSFLY